MWHELKLSWHDAIQLTLYFLVDIAGRCRHLVVAAAASGQLERGFAYHGRVAAVADAVRAQGLEL